jgi:hypothetical protein
VSQYAMVGRLITRGLAAGTLLLALGCSGQTPKPAEPKATQRQEPLRPDQARPQVDAALRRGDYAEAVRLVERTALPRAQIDQAAGLLLIDSLVDVRTATHPPGNLEDGLRRVEAAALAGHAGAATSLRALFHTGLSNQGRSTQLVASPELESCWGDVAAGAGSATHCVELRRGAGQ